MEKMTSKWLVGAVFNIVIVIMMVIVLYHSMLSWIGIHYFLHQTGSVEIVPDTNTAKVQTTGPSVPTKRPMDMSIKKASNQGISYYPKEVTDFLCLEEIPMLQFQMHQWYQATHEIFGPNNKSQNIGINDKDMGFYKETYGALNVQLNRNKEANELGFDSLLYHRIYKNGNDNIRSLLYEYAHYLSNEHSTFLKHQCPADKCVHKQVQSYYNPQLRTINQSEKRYAFTFVREPIVRFVSAVNEIESRAYLEKSKTDQLQLQQPLGTHHRFMEFVDKVLMSGASKFLFRDNEYIEMGHIAPMIGTLLYAKSVDKNPLHLYRFEQFKAEWHRLSEETKLRELKFVFDRRTKRSDWVQHASATDPVNVTKASLQFLSLAGNDAKRRFGSRLTSMNSHLLINPHDSLESIKPFSRRYLKALCRIYLIDYICTNYELPVECRPLKTEIIESVQLMKLSTPCTNKPCWDKLRETSKASKSPPTNIYHSRL